MLNNVSKKKCCNYLKMSYSDQVSLCNTNYKCVSQISSVYTIGIIPISMFINSIRIL